MDGVGLYSPIPEKYGTMKHWFESLRGSFSVKLSHGFRSAGDRSCGQNNKASPSHAVNILVSDTPCLGLQPNLFPPHVPRDQVDHNQKTIFRLHFVGLYSKIRNPTAKVSTINDQLFIDRNMQLSAVLTRWRLKKWCFWYLIGHTRKPERLNISGPWAYRL